MLYMVPVVGVEPTRYHYHRILSPARLPIPSYRHISALLLYYLKVVLSIFICDIPVLPIIGETDNVLTKRADYITMFVE